MSGWKIIDWQELGQPAVELVTGAIAGRPRRIAATIDKLLSRERVRTCGNAFRRPCCDDRDSILERPDAGVVNW